MLSRAEQPRITDYLLIAGVCLLCFLPFLGAPPLFDWDEINFAESAREMLVTGNYFQVQINYEPFWEKPPLFIWMQAASMKLFGVNEFAARLPNALAGIAVLIALFRFGCRLAGRRFGWLITGFFFASFLPFLYFKSGIIDPLFNFFIFLSLVHIIRFESGESGTRHALASGFWAGVATLTKGPVALIVAGLVYVIYTGICRRFRFAWKELLLFTAVYALVILSWFGAILLFTENGGELIRKFIVYQAELFSQPVAGHQQPFYYHLVVFLVGCFPMSAFAFGGMFAPKQEGRMLPAKRIFLIWFWVVLILFSISQTKIVHYSSMLYFPGAFFAALYVHEIIMGRQRLHWLAKIWVVIPLALFSLALGSINIVLAKKEWLIEMTRDPFGKANLTAGVEWTGWEWVAGFLLAGGGAIAVYFLLKKRLLHFLAVQAATNAVVLILAGALIAPRVAGYSQKAATDFFAAHEGAYFIINGYKSYAHYFYGKVKPFPHPEIPLAERTQWMLSGPADGPVYMVVKKHHINEKFRIDYGNFDILYEEAGFVFLERRH